MDTQAFLNISSEDKAVILGRVEAILSSLEEPAVREYPSLEEARALMFQHTEGVSLRAHMLGVEASMAAYAKKLGEDELSYRLAGLLHDFDYEKHSTPTQHPFVGCELLVGLGYPRELILAILGHATYADVPRESQVAKTLFAVDELTGFLSAIAYVRPNGLTGLKWKSFQKKFKTANFAAAVSREEVLQGAEELGVDMREHVLFLADSLQQAFPHFPHIPEAEEA